MVHFILNVAPYIGQNIKSFNNVTHLESLLAHPSECIYERLVENTNVGVHALSGNRRHFMPSLMPHVEIFAISGELAVLNTTNDENGDLVGTKTKAFSLIRGMHMRFGHQCGVIIVVFKGLVLYQPSK